MEKYGDIKIKRDSEVAKLITQLGSKNKTESLAAAEAFAAFIGPVIQTVLEQAPVIANLYETETFLEGTAPSLPLDVYFDVKDRNFINVWTQSIAGGLATSEVKGLSEMFVSTYNLDSAVSMPKKYAREARLNVVAATLTRMAQEILVKQEINSASILLKALADGRYDADSDGTDEAFQVIRSQTANQFSLDEFNRLITLLGRMKGSWWANGTPTGGAQGITHLVGSLEFLEQIRSIAYQPVNTRSGAVDTSGASSLAAPDNVRSMVWQTAGIPSFFGVEIVPSWELGVSRRYNTLFKKYAGASAYQGYGQSGTAVFDPATEELVMALNLNGGKSLVKLVEEGSGSSTVKSGADDQWSIRSDKVGFFTETNEGRVCLDSRGIAGLLF
jgi:hypothetical protein